MKTVTVLGSGSWGTALAHHLRNAGHSVRLWGIDANALGLIENNQENPEFFPGVKLAAGIKGTLSLGDAISNANIIVSCLPSSAVREVAKKLRGSLKGDMLVVSCTKGLESKTNYRMSVVLSEELGTSCQIAALSGPSFAAEVVRGLPTAIVAAAEDLSVAEKVVDAFHYESFRVYTSTDLVGVELGGVLKNIIALAVGVLDGAEMGANARAALITRGLIEMQRLIVSLGGKAETVTGLSGLGDLLLTATGDLSRNRQVGLRLGRREKLEKILSELGQVAEAVTAAQLALALAKEKKVTVPIIEEVNKVLQGGSVSDSLSALFSRAPKSEL